MPELAGGGSQTYPSSESLGVLSKIRVPGVPPRLSESEPVAFIPESVL